MNVIDNESESNTPPQFISFCDFPETFQLEHTKNLNSSYHFDTFNIRTVLWYSNYIGVEKSKQRLFAIVFMRLMPQYILGEGSIDIDFETNRLIVYFAGQKPISVAQIE